MTLLRALFAKVNLTSTPLFMTKAAVWTKAQSLVLLNFSAVDKPQMLAVLIQLFFKMKYGSMQTRHHRLIKEKTLGSCLEKCKELIKKD